MKQNSRVQPTGQKRWFRVRLQAADGVRVAYIPSENTSGIYRRLEREGIPRTAVLSTTAYADVRPGCTPRVVREGVTW